MGRDWFVDKPHGLIVCDCYRYCEICGRALISVEVDLRASVYRNEDARDPAGVAEPSEVIMRTRLYCPSCGVYSDGVPVEIEW